jgi:hypothetical protein
VLILQLSVALRVGNLRLHRLILFCQTSNTLTQLFDFRLGIAPPLFQLGNLLCWTSRGNAIGTISLRLGKRIRKTTIP